MKNARRYVCLDLDLISSHRIASDDTHVQQYSVSSTLLYPYPVSCTGGNARRVFHARVDRITLRHITLYSSTAVCIISPLLYLSISRAIHAIYTYHPPCPLGLFPREAEAHGRGGREHRPQQLQEHRERGEAAGGACVGKPGPGG